MSRELYSAVMKLEESGLGKYLRDRLAKSRAERVEALIYHAKNSTDNVISRIAWSLESDSVLLESLELIKQEVEGKQPNPKEPEESLAFGSYTVPDMVGVGDWKFNP